MDNNKTVIFQKFARKAKERLEEKKKKRTKQLYVKDVDMMLTVRGISDEEYAEISEMENMTEIERDKYLLYYACPELQDTAGILVEEGILTEEARYKITDIFLPVDRTALCREILALSGLLGESSVTGVGNPQDGISEVEEVKN